MWRFASPTNARLTKIIILQPARVHLPFDSTKILHSCNKMQNDHPPRRADSVINTRICTYSVITHLEPFGHLPPCGGGTGRHPRLTNPLALKQLAHLCGYEVDTHTRAGARAGERWLPDPPNAYLFPVVVNRKLRGRRHGTIIIVVEYPSVMPHTIEGCSKGENTYGGPDGSWMDLVGWKNMAQVETTVRQ